MSLVADADSYTQAGVGAGSAAVLDALDANGPGDRAVYLRFDLSTIDLTEATSATLKLYKTAGTRNDTIITQRFDVYGLPPLAGNTPQDWNESTLSEGGLGAEYTSTLGNGPDTSRLVNLDAESGAAVTETVLNVDGAAQTLTGPDLLAFLQARKGDDGLATFVTYVDAGAVRGWGYSSRQAADPALRPTLEIEGGTVMDPVDPYPANPVVLPRQVENLDRGVIAMRRSTSEVYVGWRLLGNDAADVAFNLYRQAGAGAPQKLNAAPLTSSTNFVDTTFSVSQTNTYFVRAIVGGVEQDPSESYTVPVFAPIQQHLDIPLVIPAGGITPSGEAYTYSANDASVGDLDGDGQYEVILKWDPSNSRDNSQSGYTGNTYLDAYTLQGQLLWRIDLGQNIRSGAHYTQFVVYDLDGDGRAEIAMKTAPGTIDGRGNPVLLGSDQVSDDYRNSSGYVLSGPEYYTVFDGSTGAQRDTVALGTIRGDVSEWGDSYGNRVDRFTTGVAYLDGVRPSIVLGRGYYGPQSGNNRARNEIVAYDFRNGELTQRWLFQANLQGLNTDYIGEGSHSLTVGDVDGDGFDEIIYGASAIDDNGVGLYATGLGHGDALHLADMDPTNPGLEVFMAHETPSRYQSGGRNAGGELRDAMTGELLFQIPATNDVGRGVAADIDPNHPGYEFWATTNDPEGGVRMIFNVRDGAIYAAPSNMMYNFAIWWDGDLSRELLDGTTISEWNNPGRINLVSPSSSGINSTSGLSGNNGTKNTPSLQADLFGDWREEVIWRRADNTALEVWTTTIVTNNRIPTLMHDTQYRVSIAAQNSAYNQPPHPSYWIGVGMPDPPRPPLFFGGELAGDYNLDGAVNAADYSVWRDSLGSKTNLAADGDHNGVVDQGDLSVWSAHYGETATATALALVTTPTAQRAIDQQQGMLTAAQASIALISAPKPSVAQPLLAEDDGAPSSAPSPRSALYSADAPRQEEHLPRQARDAAEHEVRRPRDEAFAHFRRPDDRRLRIGISL